MKRNKLLARLAATLLALSIGVGAAGCGNAAKSASPSTQGKNVQKADSTQESAAESTESDSNLITNDDGSVSQDVYAMDTYMSIRAK